MKKKNNSRGSRSTTILPRAAGAVGRKKPSASRVTVEGYDGFNGLKHIRIGDYTLCVGSESEKIEIINFPPSFESRIFPAADFMAVVKKFFDEHF